MKVLVLGASGKIGYKIFSHLRDSGFEVAGTYHSNSAIPYIDQKADLEQTDATNIGRLHRLFHRTGHDIIVDAIGNPNPDWCEANKNAALDVNTFTARNIAFASGKKLIFISTDYVFDGLNNPYAEEDEPRPINYYGLTKHLAEFYVQDFNPRFVILRLPLIYNKEDIRAMADGIGNWAIYDPTLVKHPTWVGDVAEAVKVLIEKDAYGIYHLGNGEGITRHEWALKIARFFGFSEDKIIAASPSYLAKRPLNVELNTSKVGHLGVRCKKVDEVMEELF